MLVFETRHISIHEKGTKILTPKQMLQRLPIAFAQAKTGNIQKIYQMKSGKLFILCIIIKNLLKNYIII